MREEDRKLVIETLSERADGMYVYLSNALDMSSNCRIGFVGCIANWRIYVTVSRQASEAFLMNCPKLSTRLTSGC